MKKVISFSLWGDNPKYTVGALKNIDLLPMVYPGWDAYFYVGKTVPDKILYHMEIYDNVKIIQKEENNDWTSMFWRFEASYDKDVNITIFRDTDSRLSLREKLAVDEWIKSDKTFHIMRDHPYHKFPILGGMWGVKNNNNYNLEKLIKEFYNNYSSNRYGTDYEFFIQKLYPIIKEDCLVHDEFFEKKSFPNKRYNYDFVGQVFDENDVSIPEHMQILKNYIG